MHVEIPTKKGLGIGYGIKDYYDDDKFPDFLNRIFL
tara:strand:- start:143 stop:250 length:108 start_codon:yes stop_codon:yes gene_type:complete